MTTSKSRIAVLLVAIAVVASAVALPAMAGTVDTTNDATSSSTSDWADGTTVTGLTNSSKNATIQVDMTNASTGDADRFTLRLTNNATGRTVYETGQNWTAVNASQGNFNLTVGHATVFETLERDAGENVTVDVDVIFNESQSDEETVSFQIYANNDETNAVLVSTGENDGATIRSASAGLVSLQTLTTLGGILGSTNDSGVGAAAVNGTVGVNKTATSSITVVMDNSDLQTAFGDVSSLSAGTLATNGYVLMNDKPIPLFSQSADASWLDTSNETYATVASGGEQVEIHNAAQTVDKANVTIRAVGSEAAGFRRTFGMLRAYGAGRLTALQTAAGAINLNGNPFETSGLLPMGLGGLVLVALPTLRRRRGP